MKQTANTLRWRGALVPLLALLAAGCGSSFLGDVDGSGSFTALPSRQVVLTGTAVVEEQVASRQAGDRVVANGILRVRRYTASGQAVEVPVVSGLAETDDKGRFTLAITVDQSTQGRLWEIEVFGTVQGVGQVLLTAVFVPGTASTLTLTVDMATTLVSASLASAAGAQGDIGTLTQGDIEHTAQQLRATLRTGNAIGRSDLPTGGNATEARAKLAALTNKIVQVMKALVARVEIVNRQTLLASTGAPGLMALGVNRDATLMGRALAADGSELAIGVEFVIVSQQPSATLSLTQARANEVSVRGNVLGGSARIAARPAVPGQGQSAWDAERALLDIRVISHDQGHAQGTAAGL